MKKERKRNFICTLHELNHANSSRFTLISLDWAKENSVVTRRIPFDYPYKHRRKRNSCIKPHVILSIFMQPGPGVSKANPGKTTFGLNYNEGYRIRIK